MAEISIPWSGTTIGDCGPYTDDQWSDMWSAMFTAVPSVNGVFINNLTGGSPGRLKTTNPAGNTIRVGGGAALVDGKFYKNDANVDFTIVTPGAGSNYYTIVIRKSVAAQTVRLAILGPSAVTYPTPTQVHAVTWELPISHVRRTSAGVTYIYDRINTMQLNLSAPYSQDSFGHYYCNMSPAMEYGIVSHTTGTPTTVTLRRKFAVSPGGSIPYSIQLTWLSHSIGVLDTHIRELQVIEVLTDVPGNLIEGFRFDANDDGSHNLGAVFWMILGEDTGITSDTVLDN